MNQRKRVSTRPRTQTKRASGVIYVALLVIALVALRVCRGGIAPMPDPSTGTTGLGAAPAELATLSTRQSATPNAAPGGQPAMDEPTATRVDGAVAVLAEGVSGLPTIAYADLPAEAKTTLALIQQGGPFPFVRDGSTFQNRERLLPLKPSGYYREYTVITPGANDRGARRIVAGADGEAYYTDDHYASFKEIVR